MFFTNIKKYIIILSIFLNIFLCNITLAKEEIKKTDEQYNFDGMYYFADRSYTSSAEQFEALTQRYPYSSYTHNALLMEIYTNFLDNELDKIPGIAEVFYRLFPLDKNTDYVLYMHALSGLLYKPWFRKYKLLTDEARSMSKVYESEVVLTKLVNDFPESKYTEDAKQKLLYIKGLKQLNEVFVGERYQKLGNFIGAMKRYTGMFEIYKDDIHPQIEERLLCNLVGLTKTLKLDTESEKYKQLLQKKYPSNKCK